MRRGFCILLLIASVARAGVYNNTPSLPGTKQDAAPNPLPTNQKVTASEFNNFVTNVSNLNIDAQTGKTTDLRWCGAAGNGSTDDTQAFQNCLNYAADAGTTVFVPPLNFKVTSSLTVPANVRIAGGGKASIISGNVGANPVFSCGNSNNTIQDLNIQATGRTGILASGSGYVFKNNYISNQTQIGGDSGQTGGIILETVTDSWVVRNILSGNGAQGGTVGGVPWGQGLDVGTYNGTDGNHRLHILDNQATSTLVYGNFGFFNTDTTDVSHNIATGALIDASSSGGYGIFFYDSGGTHTHGSNRITNNRVYTEYGSCIYSQANPDTLIENNSVDNCALHETPSTLVVASIAVGNGQRNIVRGNTVTGGTRDAIGVEGPGNLVEGNDISAPSQHGVLIYGGTSLFGTSDGTQVLGGVITSPAWAGVATQDYLNGTFGPINNVTIANVTVINAGNGTGRAAFGLTSLWHSTFSNLQVNKAGGSGIQIEGGGYNKLVDSRVIDGSQGGGTNQGIQVVDSSFNEIRNCTSRNGAAAHQTYGLSEVHATGTSPDYNEYYDNDFSYNGSAGLNIVGSHSKKKGNKVAASYANGTATLVAGTVTVSNASVAAGDELSLAVITSTPSGIAMGAISYTLSAGVSFTINSSAATDTSTLSYQIKHAAPIMGTASLSTGGTITVSTAESQTGDAVRMSVQAPSGTQGILSLGMISAGTSFVINSTNASDRSAVLWEIVH